MKTSAKILSAIGIAAVSVAVVAGARQLAASQEPVKTEMPAARRTPGIVQFAPGAAELSALRIAPVSEAPLPVAEPVNGRIAYDENVTARVSSPIPGRVVGVRAEIGDRVSRNAVLLDIDSPELANAEADWRKGQADELRKKLALERARSLLEHEVIARKDYESAQADYLQAVAETRRAALRMKNLNAAGNENGKFGLKAPIAGVVADKQVNPGLEVRPDLQNPLFVITDIGRLWVLADVPERSIGGIRPGQAVSIETDAYPNERFAATVERVGLALDPATRRVQVRCSVKNPEHKLKPEMFARVSFLADGRKTGVQVPNTGLVADGLHSYVFVEKQPGTFEKRAVTVTVRGSDSSFIEGVSGGERVVTEGALLLNSEAAGDAQ
ncbi:efflux RND transporter periplasmic adaptor subunit [Ralstonia sp. RL]|uniref:efflux RND transporter periplasmic adaptor subunit n=1 Tax=Ralstonia sp. RL TaxID=1839756 RepID=UPI000B1A5DAB|nr:efflux RND transporter periplasmic adaptor subunit [Ralstonia sp. RL]